MKISTEIGSIAAIIGEEKAIELVAKAGFDAYDFSMFAMCDYDWTNKRVRDTHHPLVDSDYRSFVNKLGRIASEHGIVCNQSHAPFPTACPEIRSYFKRAIECTAMLGGEICVIHPDNDKAAAENAKMYEELLPFAKEYGVKIAVENMWNWQAGRAFFAACSTAEDFVAHLDAVNDPYLVACLDIGHAEMMGEGVSAVEMICALGDRLAALRQIGYNGYLTLEADNYLRTQGYNESNVFDGVCKLAASAKRLSDMLERNTV